jgi:hypothetical protein
MAFETTSKCGIPQEERSGAVFARSGDLQRLRTAPELNLGLRDGAVSLYGGVKPFSASD